MSDFVFHYYLRDRKHSINSLTLCRSQEEFALLVEEVASIFGVGLRVEAVVSVEGGFVQKLKFIGENVAALTFVSGLITSLLGGVFWLSHQNPLLRQQSEINEQQKKINEQQLEKNKIEIEKAKIELEKIKREAHLEGLPPNTRIDNGRNLILNLENPPSIEDLVMIIIENKKIIKKISNIYAVLDHDPLVTAVGYATRAEPKEVIVDRRAFEKFILVEKNVDDLIVDDAVLEITAPVLNEKDLKWRGIFEGKNIPFTVIDSSFKLRVLSKKINFHNGSKISCKLIIKQKINAIGDLEVSEYIVDNIVVVN